VPSKAVYWAPTEVEAETEGRLGLADGVPSTCRLTPELSGRSVRLAANS